MKLVILLSFLIGFSSFAKYRYPVSLNAEVEGALSSGDNFELYSLDPSSGAERLQHSEPNRVSPDFYQWFVFGKVEILDKTVQKAIVTSLEKGVKNLEGSLSDKFTPSYALRITKGKNVFDLVICFHCHEIDVYKNERKIKRLLTSNTAEKMIQGILKENNIPEAKLK